MNKFTEKLNEHEWVIVHFKYNNSLYMDGAYIGDFVRNNHISETIYAIAKHINRDIMDLPKFEIELPKIGNEETELPFN